MPYVANTLKNPQALKNIMDDFDETVEKSENQADTFGYCKSRRLRELNLCRIGFARHRYLFVYRIHGNQVIVKGMYHELQDYENAIT